MATQRVNQISVTATFDVGAETLVITGDTSRCPGQPPNSICAPQGLSRIALTLVTANGPGTAVLAARPVIWMGLATGEAAPEAPAFSVERLGSVELALWDFNEVKEQRSYPFTLVIDYQGTGYYSDPTVINQPPG